MAAEASDSSDSGLETRFVVGMRRIGVAVRQQAWILGRPVDGLIGERLVVQLDGFAHHGDARQRRDDIAHDRTLVLAGYTVLPFDYQQIMHQWPLVVAEARVRADIPPPGTRATRMLWTADTAMPCSRPPSSDEAPPIGWNA